MSKPTYFVRRTSEFASPISKYAATDPFGVNVYEWCAELARYTLTGCMYTETARAIHGDCALVDPADFIGNEVA